MGKHGEERNIAGMLKPNERRLLAAEWGRKWNVKVGGKEAGKGGKEIEKEGE